jgi:hypothetical protein
MAIEQGPYLTKFQHMQEAESGGADDSSFNGLMDDAARQVQIGFRIPGEEITITATSYPGTPDFRFPVTPFIGQYLVAQMLIERTAGSGDVTVKVEVEAPVATLTQAFTQNHSTTNETAFIKNADLSALGGADRRGEDGWVNVYLKVSDGSTTGKLNGISIFTSEDVTTNTYLLWW